MRSDPPPQGGFTGLILAAQQGHLQVEFSLVVHHGHVDVEQPLAFDHDTACAFGLLSAMNSSHLP